eukprot:9308730-Alexandrium_andersonii.AAC.1
MSASLVGSEMCIRDSPISPEARAQLTWAGRAAAWTTALSDYLASASRERLQSWKRRCLTFAGACAW